MIKIFLPFAMIILFGCSEKEIVADSKRAQKEEAPVLDSSKTKTIAQETYSTEEFDRPLLIPFNDKDLTLPQHYYDSLHLVGWSDDGKLCLIEEPSMLSMSDEYQMKFIINGAAGNSIFQWQKPARAQTKDAYSTLGLYLGNFIAKMNEQGIKPLKQLELFQESSLEVGNDQFTISIVSDNDSSYTVMLTNAQKSHPVASLPIHKSDPFGYESAEYYAHFYSHDYAFICLLIHEVHKHTEGDVRHHLQPVIVDSKIFLD